LQELSVERLEASAAPERAVVGDERTGDPGNPVDHRWPPAYASKRGIAIVIKVPGVVPPVIQATSRIVLICQMFPSLETLTRDI
jgi:hypothetical protein